MKLPPETEQLLLAYFAGDTSDQTIHAMEAWLREDPGNPRILAEYGLVDRLLAHEQKKLDTSAIFALLLEAEASAEPIVVEPSVGKPSRPLRRDQESLPYKQALLGLQSITLQTLRQRSGLIGGIAALLAIALVLVITFGPGTGEIPQGDRRTENTNTAKATVAQLTGESNAQWRTASGTAAPGVGDALHANQRLSLIDGFAEITTNRGAVAILKAPATIELLDSNNAIYLYDGKLVGLCYSDTSKGFVVKTDHADVTDLGTEFGVEISDNQFTATVLTGEIAISTPDNKSKVLTDDQTATLSLETNATLAIEQGLAKGFEELIPRIAQAHALRNDPAMIAYWGFEAEDIVDGKLLNRAAATQGKMDGTLGQPGKPDSAPTLTEGRRPGTNALRFEAKQFDIVRIGAEDARALNNLEQFTIGLWVKPDHMDQASHHLVTKRRGDTCSLNLALVWDDGAFDPNALLFHSGRGGLHFNEHATGGDTLPRASDWLHIVVTFDRGERRYYVNGELVGTKPSVATGKTFAMESELCIGSIGAGVREAATHLDGDLDELFILGRAMSPDEITTLYKTGVAQH